MKRLSARLTIWLLINALCVSMGFAASDSPQAFTFQGRLFNAAGTDPLEEPVLLKFQILDPSANCLLYQETQNVNLTNQSGVFAVSVGSLIGAPKRTAGIDPAFTMTKVFKNDPLAPTRAVDATYCPSGYTPTAGDHRLLRVTVTPSSTNIPDILSPDQVINSVPLALVAETLQGLAPIDFIQKDPIYVTDANVKKIFGSLVNGVVDASALHHHDGRYVRLTGTGGLNSAGKVSVGTSSDFTATTLSVKADDDANVGLAIRASSGAQSADLFQVQNSAGTKIAGISATGGLSALTSVLTSNAGDQLVIQHDTTNKQTIDVSSTGTTSFTAAGSAPKFSFMNGNVGVGTTSPSTALSVTGTISINNGISTAGISSNGAGTLLLNASNLSGANVYGKLAPSGNGWALGDTAKRWNGFFTNGDFSGNVGIGTTSPVSKLHLGVAPTATANYGLLSLGSGAFDGSTSGYFGTSSSSNSNGTIIAINAASGYVGDLVNFQVGGDSKFKVNGSGNVTISGQTELAATQALTTPTSAVTKSLGDSRWNSPYSITTVQTGGNNSWGNIQMGILPFVTGRPDATVDFGGWASSPPDIKFVPYWINGPKTITSAVIKILGGTHASEVLRAAIYDSDANGMPKNRVGSQWAWPASSTGKITASIGTINLTRGLYWLALQKSAGNTAWGGGLTVLGYPLSQTGQISQIMGTVVSGWDIYAVGALPTAYGWTSMPADASTGGGNGVSSANTTMPAVLLY